MARAGYTRKPCHGCGESSEYRGRPTESVCDECKELLSVAREVMTRKAKAIESGAFLRSASQEHWDNGITIGYVDGVETEDRDAIVDAVHQIVMHYKLMTVESFRGEALPLFDQPRASFHHSSLDTVVEMPPPVADALRTILPAIKTALESARARGLSDGRNVLLSLADGSMSSAEFDGMAPDGE